MIFAICYILKQLFTSVSVASGGYFAMIFAVCYILKQLFTSVSVASGRYLLRHASLATFTSGE